MQLAIQTYTMGRKQKELDLERMCAFTRETVGLEAMDWCGLHGSDPESVRKLTDKFGIKNFCYTAKCDFDAPASERPAVLAQFREMLDIAKVLGAGMVMLPVPGKKDRPREETRQAYAEGLAEGIPLAAEAGITVTIEHFPAASSPFISSDDMNRIAEAVPGVKVCFDSGNVSTAGENAGDAFRKNAPHVAYAHFKDFHFSSDEQPGWQRNLDGRWRQPALVGDGDTDNRAALQAMKECGFKGCINIEYEGNEMAPPEAVAEGVRRVHAWMDELGIAR